MFIGCIFKVLLGTFLIVAIVALFGGTGAAVLAYLVVVPIFLFFECLSKNDKPR
jgi:hypothetical protein